MSKVYQIRLSSSVVRTIHASDEMTHRVELTPILDAEEMADVLRGSLREAGWEEQEDGTFSTEGPSGETLVWDLEAGTVVARTESESEVSAEVSATGWGGSDQAARDNAARALERQKARVDVDVRATEENLQRELTDKLSASEQERQRALNGVIQRVYAESLKRKAATLGTVVSVEENDSDEDYELVIKIAE